MFDMKPICKTCSKPKTLQRTGVTRYWVCVPCWKASDQLQTEPESPETFPRPPSNEQTLLAELGQAKADRDLSEWHRSELVKERDALAVTAERLAWQIKILRESLEYCLEMIPKAYHDSLVVDDARAILKETAP